MKINMLFMNCSFFIYAFGQCIIQRDVQCIRSMHVITFIPVTVTLPCLSNKSAC